MKYLISTLLLIATLGLNGQAKTVESEVQSTDKINWMTWDEAMAANKITPKKIFIDIYTDWCGWCKKMDSTTFKDPNVVEEMNNSFYAIKFDAEMKKDITFNDAVFSFVNTGRRGAHQLAFALVDGRMSYPSFVLLDENFHRVMLAPGYQTPDKLIPQLKYTSTNAYKTKNFEAFKTSGEE